MQSCWVKAMMILLVSVAPGPALAQCGSGMMGGGHDHGQSQDREDPVAKSESKGDQKTRQSVSKLLSVGRSRGILLDAILADPGFMRLLAQRIAADPGWRAMFLTRMESTEEGTAGVRTDSVGAAGVDPTPRPQAAIYRCPMHAEVTSASPGMCPKCGMDLKRVE